MSSLKRSQILLARVFQNNSVQQKWALQGRKGPLGQSLCS